MYKSLINGSLHYGSQVVLELQFFILISHEVMVVLL